MLGRNRKPKCGVTIVTKITTTRLNAKKSQKSNSTKRPNMIPRLFQENMSDAPFLPHECLLTFICRLCLNFLSLNVDHASALFPNANMKGDGNDVEE